MTREDLQTLLEFHYWARDRMLEALEPLTSEQYLRDLGSSFRSARDTAAHSYSAEWIWYQRWQGTSPRTRPSPDEFPDTGTLRHAWAELETKVRAFVAGLGEDEVERIIPYTLLDGTSSALPIWQMLQHVVNHATYHRGQVATMLRQLGAGPLKSTDMATYYRERAS
jgi:uncharacterized damage-inducible protein DinB